MVAKRAIVGCAPGREVNDAEGKVTIGTEPPPQQPSLVNDRGLTQSGMNRFSYRLVRLEVLRRTLSTTPTSKNWVTMIWRITRSRSSTYSRLRRRPPRRALRLRMIRSGGGSRRVLENCASYSRSARRCASPCRRIWRS